MQHMELFHHFNTVTAGTLVFGEDIWRKEVISLSFKVYPSTGLKIIANPTPSTTISCTPFS